MVASVGRRERVGQPVVLDDDNLLGGAALLEEHIEAAAVGVFEGVVDGVVDNRLQGDEAAGRIGVVGDGDPLGAVEDAAADKPLRGRLQQGLQVETFRMPKAARVCSILRRWYSRWKRRPPSARIVSRNRTPIRRRGGY